MASFKTLRSMKKPLNNTKYDSLPGRNKSPPGGSILTSIIMC